MSILIVDLLTVFEAILNLIKPGKDVSLDGSNLEEHFQALLEIALKLLEKDLKPEEGCRTGLFNEALDILSTDVILVPLD